MLSQGKAVIMAASDEKAGKTKIVIAENGPYLVSGALPLDKQIIEIGSDGNPSRWAQGEKFPAQESRALCRCGGSRDKPFCDGLHAKNGFDGTETASREPFVRQAETINGPDLVLDDAQDFCALARFCHRKGSVWEFTENSGEPESRKNAISNACDCASGRLVARDKKTGKPIENKFVASLSLIEDPQKKVSGPLWVKGGVRIESADGSAYEKRNRVTLCRCGRSGNKPFCDGTHVSCGFNDGDETLKR